jgi:hypothetical protein
VVFAAAFAFRAAMNEKRSNWASVKMLNLAGLDRDLRRDRPEG